MADTAFGRLKVTRKREYAAIVDSMLSDECAVLWWKLDALDDVHSNEDASGVAVADPTPPLSIQWYMLPPPVWIPWLGLPPLVAEGHGMFG